MGKSKFNVQLVAGAKKSNRVIKQGIHSRILSGLLVGAPIAITLWLAYQIYAFLSSWGIKLAEKIPALAGYAEEGGFGQHGIRIAALVLLLIGIILLGQVANITIGKKLIELAQNILLHIPIVKTIFSTCQQLGEAIGNSAGNSMFSKVVMFEYPNPGTYAIGFMTNENTQKKFEPVERLGTPLISVFMPTTPNPTSGFLFLIPCSKCIFLDMSVSDAMKLIVSVGGVLPEDVSEKLQENGQPADTAKDSLSEDGRK